MYLENETIKSSIFITHVIAKNISVKTQELSIVGKVLVIMFKGIRWMPRLKKLMKDVAACDKPR